MDSILTSLLTVLYLSDAYNISKYQISNCTHMKEMTSCAAEDFSWEGILRQWMFPPNVKEFITMKLLRVEKLTYIYIKVSCCGLLQNLLDILWGMGGQKPELYFLTSPLLFLLYAYHLSFTFPPCFSLHYFIVSQCWPHCLVFLSVLPHTGPPPGLRNMPSKCQPCSDMSSYFPNPVQQTRQLGARLATRRRPEEVQPSAKTPSLSD